MGGGGGGGDGSSRRREKVSFSSKKSLVRRQKLGKGRSALGAFRARLLGGERWQQQHMQRRTLRSLVDSESLVVYHCAHTSGGTMIPASLRR